MAAAGARRWSAISCWRKCSSPVRRSVRTGSRTGRAGRSCCGSGTEEQRRQFLPGIIAGELAFCIGLSEPDSGSDLASLRTRATRVDGGWQIDGTKVWTTNAHECDYMIALVRTAPVTEGAPRPVRAVAVPDRPDIAGRVGPSDRRPDGRGAFQRSALRWRPGRRGRTAWTGR